MRTFAGSRIRFACCSVILSATLAACGGGSGASTSAQTDTSTPPVTTTPSPTPVTPAPTNNAPKIAGTAQTSATAGQAYQFKPTATDADQDAVTFTITNKPAWAAFNATSGALTGTPAATDVGTYSGITIAATDGKSATGLPPFAITVAAATAATKSVSLAWTPPTQNADGSTLTDLSGYTIHYGTTSKNYTQSVSLTNAGLTRYQLDSVPSGTIYIAMTAVNTGGAESDFSPEVAFTVN
jgi:hypothetical protein